MPVAHFNRFSLELTREAVDDCSSSGPVDDAVAMWAPNIKVLNLFTPSPADIRDELREYGAWNERELEGEHDNWLRIVWLAACQIKEEQAQ